MCSCTYLAFYFQRSHALFGNQEDPFSAESANAQNAQVTNQRPLQFSESQPESPPNSSALESDPKFFPSTAPKNNTNNNAFAEWVLSTLMAWAQRGVMSDGFPRLSYFRFSFEREGSPIEFYNPDEDEEPGMD